VDRSDENNKMDLKQDGIEWINLAQVKVKEWAQLRW
jgi:hypothetical protein